MALKIVGSGLGRSGTMSMKLALEQLGFGPCHHMVEVFAHPETMPLWVDAAEGRPNWDLIFGDYVSMVDYPGAQFWRGIAGHYPDAKVLHTVRDADQWFDSTQATIFAPGSFTDNPPPHLAKFFGFIRTEFGDNIHDRSFMTDYFRRHSAEVERTIPKERLLVYEAGEGWDRLCSFLGVPVPETPFPHTNTSKEFRARVAANNASPTPASP